MKMVTLEDFCALNDAIKAKWGKKVYHYIDYCGLEPVMPPGNFGYFCTPTNSTTFAQTGGDGVHFGLVEGLNEQGNPGPVVMTVPMAEKNNVIIAEDLDEFLGIGYHVGWFFLEQIVYDMQETLTHHAMPNPDMDDDENRYMELIRKELAIQHFPLKEDRLQLLHGKYFHKLQIPDEPDNDTH